MTRLGPLFILVALLTVAAGPLFGAVEINEVMSNEPGGHSTLEWIELYNKSAGPANLSFYQLQIGATQIPLTGSLVSAGYMIVCRRLYASGDTPGFESVWGNNSGVWGDDPRENFPEPFEASFALTNSTGTVQLWLAGQVVSSLSWTASGRDGVSWERLSPDQSEVVQSKDYSGSTPGFVNSVTPLPNDLAIDTVTFNAHDGITDLVVAVENVGQNTLTDRRLRLFNYNDSIPTDESDTIATLPVPVVVAGYLTDIETSVNLDGVYRKIGFALQDDDRIRNNRKHLIVPGASWPPVRFSEIMADPQSPLTAEWVELENRRPQVWDLLGWKLCDRNSCHEISLTDLLVPRDSYLVLTSDSLAFNAYYPSWSGRAFQPTGWSALNNDSDMVTLVDSFGYVADSFSYASTYPDNYTWAREFVADGSGKWGKSAEIGGTPGSRNNVLFAPVSDHISLDISPQVISPDGDGIADAAVIRIAATPAPGYSLKIYDRYGRLVRVIFENQQYLKERYEWDGRSDAGNRLPVGIYICYFEAINLESIKKTVVIAR